MILRAIGYLISGVMVGLILGFLALGVALNYYTADLPGYASLRDYQPPVTTRVYASTGTLVAEYALQRRLYVPISAVPELLKQAYIAAEDKTFYEHGGLDYLGILRAIRDNLRNIGSGRRPAGASTITQQVARNFLLTNTVSIRRKIREMILALRLERTFNKNKILELYLNEIYLGAGSYGVAAAALNYFDKSLQELTIGEIAYLAALPKGPENYNPTRNKQRAIRRRNWVLGRMVDRGYISKQQQEAAAKEDIIVTPRPFGAQIGSAQYFAEEVRRTLVKRYSSNTLYTGGLSVRTSLDLRLQDLARKALIGGLVGYDIKRGWRGALGHINLDALQWRSDFLALIKKKSLSDVSEWKVAIVTNVTKDRAAILVQPDATNAGNGSAQLTQGIIPLKNSRWALKRAKGFKKLKGQGIGSVLRAGDVVFAEALQNKTDPILAKITADKTDGSPKNDQQTQAYRLRQIPKVAGGLVALDPYTGRIVAMVGGFSAKYSEFNRATQAYRQPGSAFKTMVYVAALDNGFTPASLVLDAPITIYSGGKIWQPSNYSHKFYGPSTLRVGIEKSRNVMTVRLAKELGLKLVAGYAERLGIYDNLQPVLAMALGAGETTLLRLTAAYGIIANGGTKIEPSLIDRIQNRYGETIYRHDKRQCPDCTNTTWQNQPEPQIIDDREQILDPMTSAQIVSMLEGVITRGTATRVRRVNRPVAGKTGTTNDYHDSWFVGFTPDLVVGVFIGYDKPQNMGRGATGGQLAAPIFATFLSQALKGKPPIPFTIPAGMTAYRINSHTGGLAAAGETQNVITELFKPGSKPSMGWHSVIGDVPVFDEQNGRLTPQLDRELQGGTGGLY